MTTFKWRPLNAFYRRWKRDRLKTWTLRKSWLFNRSDWVRNRYFCNFTNQLKIKRSNGCNRLGEFKMMQWWTLLKSVQFKMRFEWINCNFEKFTTPGKSGTFNWIDWRRNWNFSQWRTEIKRWLLYRTAVKYRLAHRLQR